MNVPTPTLSRSAAPWAPHPTGEHTSTYTTVAQPRRHTQIPQQRSEIVGAGWVGVILSATVLAALITGAINLWLARRKSREEERARIRNTCAEAYQAYADYKEFPYAIRRRDAKRPADERLRLSEALRGVQARVSYYEMWTALEAPTVGAAYADLIGQVRIVAGGAMRQAWNEPALEDDAHMNIPPGVVDLTSLGTYEHAYRDAVDQHLRKLAPRWS